MITTTSHPALATPNSPATLIPGAPRPSSADFVIMGIRLFRLGYSRDHQVLPGRRPTATVTPGPDAPAGTPAPARIRRDGSHHDALVSWRVPSRHTGHRRPGFRTWRAMPRRRYFHDHLRLVIGSVGFPARIVRFVQAVFRDMTCPGGAVDRAGGGQGGGGQCGLGLASHAPTARLPY